MTDYTELVKALRCKRDDCEGCDIAFFDNDEGWMCRYAAKDDDAADAIEELKAIAHSHCVAASSYWEELEELKAQLPKQGEIVRCKECRWGHLCVIGQHLGLDGFCSKGEREVQDESAGSV